MIAEGEEPEAGIQRLIDNQESVAGEIVAFANSDSGVLYIGVEDDAHRQAWLVPTWSFGP
ncbi:RNA-binding domain-containing protein [Candidatus Amarolinea dominans]|uniref:AlbA family DNA-binding domain-containing protein n=1 Tax=Candidatus Amarolinea dominans TaxID=3140696 RepID=UPI003135CC3C|nr:putative DNA binding domain-containing protein [Anaerolineae bacterium]